MRFHTMSEGACVPCASESRGCDLLHKLKFGGMTLEEFFDAHGGWSERTFGPSVGERGQTRGPLGPAKHLLKELVREVLPALRDGMYKTDDEREIILEEFADLQLLLNDIVRRALFTAADLRVACIAKLKKNMARSWPPIGNLDGAIEHNRSASEKAHDGVDGLTELWAISDADCEDNDAEGIAKAALRMIDRLQYAFRKSPVRIVRQPARLPALATLQLAQDQLVAMQRIADGNMTADDKRVLESVIAAVGREINEPGGPMEPVVDIKTMRPQPVRISASYCIDMLEAAWGLIANAGGGNWKLESQEWQDAAARWRDQFHKPFPTGAEPVAIAQEPPPKEGVGRSLHDIVCDDLQARKAFGLAKYKKELRAGDGRRSAVDAYQELLDLLVYFRKDMIERGVALDG